MNSKKQVKTELEGLESLRGLVEVYEEIAASRMQKVRGAVIQSRQFLMGLLDVFSKVKAAYLAQIKKLTGENRRNGKTVAVFVSANSGLYGDIVDRTFEVFSDFVRKNKPNVVVLGKLGLKMMEDKLPQVLYNYFDFSDEGVDPESFQLVMRYLIQFEKVQVFYGQFKTILSQDPAVTSVTGDAVRVEEEMGPAQLKKQYLFEPTVEDIARVFEGEILASLFEQTLHESQLAKFASRLLALDKSIDNIDRSMIKSRSELRKIGRRITNRKQLSLVSGMNLWSQY